MPSDLAPITLPPGMFRNGTEYQSAGRWFDGNLVRWVDGRLRPWGGWERLLTGSTFAFTGVPRTATAWRSNAGERFLAVGTNSKLYFGQGGTFSDITPAGLTTGADTAVEALGYGATHFGTLQYGVRRKVTGISKPVASWSLDTWGEHLVGVLSSDGRVFEWPLTGSPAVVTNAPTGNVGVLVTDERYMLALGAGGNGRRVAWCTQEDDTVWAASSLNTAGGFNLQTNGTIVAGRRSTGTNLVWTTTDLHAISYVGTPGIYNRVRVGERCGLISRNAVQVVNGVAYWMGINKQFFRFDGTLSVVPCEIHDYVFNDFNYTQREKVHTGLDAARFELKHFYCSAASTEIDRCAVYNYAEKFWYFTQLNRTCWLDADVFPFPIAISSAGVPYEHETGWTDDGAARAVYAQSGPAEVGTGAKTIYSNLLLPDAENGDAIQVTFKTRFAPRGPETAFGPYDMIGNAEGYTPVRFTGRQAAVRVDQIVAEDWSLGTPRFKLTGGGSR